MSPVIYYRTDVWQHGIYLSSRSSATSSAWLFETQCQQLPFLFSVCRDRKSNYYVASSMSGRTKIGYQSRRNTSGSLGQQEMLWERKHHYINSLCQFYVSIEF